MFTVEERERVRERLLALAEADADVVGAAIIGSYVAGGSDQWSDIDLAFAIRGELSDALERWTELLYEKFDAIHHWDVPWGSSIYRVFLLPGWLEVDIAFTRPAEFGARGPNWRTVFGETVDVDRNVPVDRDVLIGIPWHHILHARMCIERGKPWQAEYLIGALRDHALALACLRLGKPTRYAKGFDLLPQDVTTPFEESFVRSLDEPELRRALAAAAEAYAGELERTDAALAERLRPMVLAFSAAPPTGAARDRGTAARDGDGERLWFLGTLATIRIPGEAVGGRFSLIEFLFPRNASPPLHTHPQDESYFVLDGRLTLKAGEERFDLRAGDAAVAPMRVPHTFRVDSETARVLVLSTPAGIERMVRDGSTAAGAPTLPPRDALRPSAEEVERLFAKHGQINLGPPLEPHLGGTE